VDKEGFKQLVGGLIGPLSIRSRPFMVKLLNKQYQETKENLILELSKASHVSTTADCWTARQKSFLGMTVHWLDVDEVTRQSACLGVRRIYGSHTYDVLAKAISEMHKEFKISSKVNLTITDNGSNFLKAFRMFQAKDAGNERASNEASDEDCFEEEEEDDFVLVDIGEIIESHICTSEAARVSKSNGSSGGQMDGLEDGSDPDDEEEVERIILPPHMRCTCHTLNLIATTDVEKIRSRPFLKIKKSLDLKLKSIWNKQKRSSLASDFIKSKMGELFVICNDTRWNSYYDGLAKVEHFIDKKDEALNETFEHFKITKLTAVEKDFLKVFVRVMKPLSQALDIFQNEESMSVGCVLPVLTVLKEKLVEMEKDRSITHCIPLVGSLLDSISARFNHLFLQKHLRLASLSDPHFKLWVQDKESKESDTDLLKNEVQRRTTAAMEFQ
jgi:predicted small metal-binding protein